MFFYIYVNDRYLENIRDSYQDEIQLVKKLKGKKQLYQLPLLYTLTLINILALVMVTISLQGFYYSLYGFLVTSYSGLPLLHYSFFNISLFLELFSIGVGTGVILTYLKV
ncbi:hypothetical protein [Halothermothrix orenii]|uniref:Uncharacterized protein n=1 Tax=Halothermothrix orenii (strain H 168 / OCM 544 / DSM 9562) TaxID=373903 RepID=B8CYL6_HALOH|nr:hypothetical protein [Halothermothrix orenii]ACL70385.1 hypothetical protein Hore_16360 [Halothermothrix orenii H 168]